MERNNDSMESFEFELTSALPMSSVDISVTRQYLKMLQERTSSASLLVQPHHSEEQPATKDAAGLQCLRSKNVAHEVIPYNYEIKGAEAAALQTGSDLHSMIKTLVVALKPAGFCFVLAPGTLSVDMKAVATVAGAKSARMADPEASQQLTGYLVGGTSALGAKCTDVPVFFDQSLLQFDSVVVNGGARGLLVRLKTADLIQCLNAKPARLCPPTPN